MKRNIMVGLALVIGLIFVIIFLLPVLLDVNRYRDRWMPVLEQALQRPVDVENARLTIFPTLGIRLEGITIADDPAFSSLPFVTIPSAQVVVQWLPLLHRRIQVDHVLVHGPTIHLIRIQNGSLNTATIGKDLSLQSPGKEPSNPGGSLKALLGVFAVERFSMTGGSLEYEDRFKGPSRSYHIDDLQLVTNSVQIGETANIQIRGTVMPYQQPLEVNGRFGPIQPTLDIPLIDVVGKLGKVEATAKGKAMAGRLELDVSIPHVSTNDMPMNAGLTKPVELNHIQVHLVVPFFSKEQSAISGVRIDPLTLDIQVGGSMIHLSGKGTPERLHLVGESSDFSSQDFPLPLFVQHPFSLEQIHFEAVLQGALIDVASLNANVFKGSLEAQGIWDGTSSPPRLSLQGNFKHFAVEPLVEAIRSSPVRLTGTGELHWSVEGSLPSSGQPNLHGPVRLKIQKGQLVGFDLVQTLEEALQLSGLLRESTGTTKFSMIDTKADLEQTGLVIRELTMEAQDFSLKGVGTIGFDRSLNLQGNLALSPAIGDRVIQRFPMAKIVTQQRELVFPFKVKGTVQQPRLQLDTKSLGDQVQQNVERRLEKALQGDEQELQQLLKDGEDVLRQLFGN